jgi:hypothetical protein
LGPMMVVRTLRDGMIHTQIAVDGRLHRASKFGRKNAQGLFGSGPRDLI